MENKEKTFEENLQELENLVKELEIGSIDLDTAIDKYTEAMKLANLCNTKLNSATEKVNKILLDNKLETFSIEEDK